MKTLVLLVVLAGCDDSGVVVLPERDAGGVGGPVSDAMVPFDLGGDFPGRCESDEDCPERSRYLRFCLNAHCAECAGDSDCTADALGPQCVANRCTCASNKDCAANANGLVCSGLPAFCGCTSTADCPSGTCAPDDYVAGKVCVPLPDAGPD